MDSLFDPTLFKDKVVLATGGGSGITRAVVEGFLRHGARALITSRSQERLDVAAAEMRAAHGADVLGVAADVRQYEQVEAVIAAALDRFGTIDILINGAAGNFMAPAAQMSANAFRTVVDIDLNGTFNVSRAAFAALETSRGNILNISAVQAFAPMPFQAHVGAAKAAIENLTKTLAIEWGGRGIRVNAIAPGPIEGTEGVERILGQFGLSEQAARVIPLKRFGALDDIANAALFLASPAAGYITGAVLVVDGGQHLAGYAGMMPVLQQVDPKL